MRFVPHKKIVSYVNRLIEAGYEVEVSFLCDREEYAEADLEIYQKGKFISGQRISADLFRYQIKCYSCPFPSRCPFYGRPYCREYTLH